MVAALCCGVLIGTAGCARSGDNTGGQVERHPDEQVAAAVRWDELVAESAAPGAAPQQALGLFAAVFGPVPGAPEVGRAPGGPVSGTAASRLLLRHWGELTSEQRTAVEQRLLRAALPATSADRQASAAATATARTSTGAFAAYTRRITGSTSAVAEAVTAPERTDRARDMARRMAERMDHHFDRPIEVFLGSAEPDDDGADDREVLGWTTPVETVDGDVQPQPDGPLDECLITVEESLTGDILESTLAHEVMHCLQFHVMGVGPMLAAPGWLIEGTAEWGGEHHVDGSPVSSPRWRDYLERERSLFSRSYSAIGFWAQLNGAATPGVWASLADILRAYTPGTQDAELFPSVVGTIDPAFPDMWAAEQLRRPDLGDPWQLDTTGLDVPDGAARTPGESPVTAEPLEVGLSPGMQRAWLFHLDELPDMSGPVALQLEVEAHGRVAWLTEDGLDGAPVQERPTFGGYGEVFCLDGRCRCDGGPAPAVSPAPSGAVLVAASGTGSSGVIRAQLVDPCEGDASSCPWLDTWLVTMPALPNGLRHDPTASTVLTYPVGGGTQACWYEFSRPTGAHHVRTGIVVAQNPPSSLDLVQGRRNWTTCWGTDWALCRLWELTTVDERPALRTEVDLFGPAPASEYLSTHYRYDIYLAADRIVMLQAFTGPSSADQELPSHLPQLRAMLDEIADGLVISTDLGRIPAGCDACFPDVFVMPDGLRIEPR